MTNPRDPDGSTRITSPSSGTSPSSTDRVTTDRVTTSHATPTHVTTSHDHDHDQPVRRLDTTPTDRPLGREGLHSYKTSAAAVFALVFGLSALFCALTGLLSPAAVLFGLIGIVLGIVGLKMSKRPGVTGHGVAVGGLVTAVLGLLIGGAVLAGLAALVNSDSQLDRVSNQIDKLRGELPSGDQVKDTVTK